MSIESALSIVASLIAIGGTFGGGYKLVKQKPLTSLVNELADKNSSVKRQRRLLYLIDKRLMLSNSGITSSYIQNFHADGRSKLAIFYDICNENNIEPTPEICKLLIGSDEPKFRREWIAKRSKSDIINPKKQIAPTQTSNETKLSAIENSESQVVYLSALLLEKYPETCNRLTDILNRHNIPFIFLEGTKDIWCRDYMPIQTPSGKFVQFKYNPSYLKDPAYSDSRSDVHHVDEVNNIKPIFSDIILDGGNVVRCENKAIITDRVFYENPNWDRIALTDELAKLLECEIIIIPAYKPDYDFTGHADGMIRFVDRNTVIVNDLDKDFVYMKNGIVKALTQANIKYINFPFFDYKIKGNNDHTIGVYLNYLEVGKLIVMPVFGVPGNLDEEAIAKLKEVFPHKIIETINYNDVALAGGILNCTTWVVTE